MEKTIQKPKVIKDAAYFATIGRKGGTKTRDKMRKLNPNYYSEIGAIGGQKLLTERGREFYSLIAKIGKITKENRYNSQTKILTDL